MLGEMVPVDHDRIVLFFITNSRSILFVHISLKSTLHFIVDFSRFRLVSYLNFYILLFIEVLLVLPLCIDIILYSTVPFDLL